MMDAHKVDQGDVKDEDDSDYSEDYSKSLVNLPTELLSKILSYLSTRDKVMIRQVSRRLHDVSNGTPLLWRDFVWCYESHHVSDVIDVLESCGRQVRRIFFPAHVIPPKVLEMVHYCAEVTCLILPKDSQLYLDDLEEIIHTMTHLQELDMFADGFVQVDRWPFGIYDDLLEVTGASVKELTLRVDYQRTLLDTIVSWAGEDSPLPSVVNIFAKNDVTNQLLIFLLTSNLRMPPFEVNVYDNRRIPLNLYPLMPLRKFL